MSVLFVMKASLSGSFHSKVMAFGGEINAASH